MLIHDKILFALDDKLDRDLSKTKIEESSAKRQKYPSEVQLGRAFIYIKN